MFAWYISRLLIYAYNYNFKKTTTVKSNQNFLIFSKKTELSKLPSGAVVFLLDDLKDKKLRYPRSFSLLPS